MTGLSGVRWGPPRGRVPAFMLSNSIFRGGPLLIRGPRQLPDFPVDKRRLLLRKLLHSNPSNLYAFWYFGVWQLLAIDRLNIKNLSMALCYKDMPSFPDACSSAVPCFPARCASSKQSQGPADAGKLMTVIDMTFYRRARLIWWYFVL